MYKLNLTTRHCCRSSSHRKVKDNPHDKSPGQSCTVRMLQHTSPLPKVLRFRNNLQICNIYYLICNESLRMDRMLTSSGGPALPPTQGLQVSTSIQLNHFPQ